MSNEVQTVAATCAISRRLRIWIGGIAAAILLVMMGLTVADVLGRYVFSAPVAGATELTELLLAAAVFLGLTAASLDGDHIAVDIVTSRLSKLRGMLLALVVSGASTAILAVVAWRLWLIGDQIAGYAGTTPTLKLPIAPLAYTVAGLCFIAAMLIGFQGIKQWRTRHG